MSEQPTEPSVVRVQVSDHQSAQALALYSYSQSVVDHAVVELSHAHPDLDRVQTEDRARRMVMSACVCRVIGFGPMVDKELFKNTMWQEYLAQMLAIYDEHETDGVAKA